MSEKPTTVAVPDPAPDWVKAVPDHAAVKKILQVNPREDGLGDPIVLFECYVEHGDNCVVTIWIEGRPFRVSVYSLAIFVDFFRREVAARKPYEEASQ